MKKLLPIICMLVLCGCNKSNYNPADDKQPIPSFTYEAYGTTVRFINYSQNSNYYEWNFGDGKRSNDRDPYHTYTKSGNYKVTLKVFNTRSTIYVKGYEKTQIVKVTN